MVVLEAEERFRLLMIRSLNGDSVAYRELLGELSRYLRGYFGRRIGASSLEDLVQETLLVLHLKRDSYDRELPFTPWAYAIARYKLAGHLRRNRAFQVPFEDAGGLLACESPEEGVASAEPAGFLERAPIRDCAPSARMMLCRIRKWLARASRPRV